jgi:hypothetical protein
MAEIQPYIRLACEGGKTEPNYFNGYLRSKGFKQPNMAFKPKDHSPIGVARAAKEEYQKAIRLKIPKDKIFVCSYKKRINGTIETDTYIHINLKPYSKIFRLF